MKTVPETTYTPIDLDALRAPVAEDWEGVNRLIYQRLGSDVALVNQVAHHIIYSGGKRLRPLTVLLAGRACGYEGVQHRAAAAVIEFIHTATLLHDDVVDASSLRRGQETANALFGNHKSKSLIAEFNYPRKGPGMMWQRFSEAVAAGGGEVRFNSKAIRLRRNNGRIASVTYLNEKKELEIPVGQVISSMPITKLLTLFEPQVPDEILEIAKNFSYRAFVIVVLIVDKKNIFRDQWLYIHSPSVKVGRIQNFKNWSEAMVPDPLKTSLGMEYFCSEDDEIWKMSDTGLIDMASRELCKLGLAEMSDIIDGFLVRQPNAYPVYDQSYDRCLEVSHDFFNTISNLQTIGRNGMHRYNNMDHSMQTGRLAAQNILGANHDLQKIKAEPEFLAEEKEVAAELFL